jgi:hypothetical protein
MAWTPAAEMTDLEREAGRACRDELLAVLPGLRFGLVGIERYEEGRTLLVAAQLDNTAILVRSYEGGPYRSNVRVVINGQEIGGSSSVSSAATFLRNYLERLRARLDSALSTAPSNRQSFDEAAGRMLTAHNETEKGLQKCRCGATIRPDGRCPTALASGLNLV